MKMDAVNNKNIILYIVGKNTSFGAVELMEIALDIQEGNINVQEGDNSQTKGDIDTDCALYSGKLMIISLQHTQCVI